METEKITSLVKSSSKRSNTARLRDIFEEVDNTLKSGVPQNEVLDTLHEMGFTFSLAGFRFALKTIRGERKKQTAPVNKEEIPALSNERKANIETLQQEKSGKEQHNQPEEKLSSDKKVRREQLADKYFTPEQTNTILNKFMNKDKK